EEVRRRSRRRGSHSVPELTLADTRLSTWEERDRAHVELINVKNDSTIVEWWDEAVAEAIQDGFLDPRKMHRSAYDYAVHVGLIKRPGHHEPTPPKSPSPRRIDVLENWHVTKDYGDPFEAPERKAPLVVGTRKSDGERIQTSQVVKSEGKRITTL